MLILKMDVLSELKNRGYSQHRIRNEKIMGQATLQQIRDCEVPGWRTLDLLCNLLKCGVGDLIAWIPDEDISHNEKENK